MGTVLLEQGSALEKERDLSTGLISLSRNATRTWQQFQSGPKKLCSTALGADPSIPLRQLSSKSDSILEEYSCPFQCKRSPAVQLLHLLDGARPVDPVRRCCGCGPLPRGGAVDMIHVEHSPMAVYPSFPI